MLREDLLFFLPGEGGGLTRERLLRFFVYMAFLIFLARILLLGVTAYRIKHNPAIPVLPAQPVLPGLPGDAPQPMPDQGPASGKPIDSI